MIAGARAFFRRRYGSSPLHLLTLVIGFAVMGYAAVRLIETRTLRVIIWFVGAAVLHDLLLVPLYTIVDGRLVWLSRFGKRDETVSPRIWLNFVRVPAAISLLLLLVFAPEIFRLSIQFYGTTGLSSRQYLTHWLAITGVLFGISALWLAVRLRHYRRKAAE